MSSLKAAKKRLLEWKADPLKFVVEELKGDPTPDQADVLRAFPHNNRLAMKASKGTGKTTTLSWLGWNGMATRPDLKGAAVSISGANLKDGLWAEFSKWQQRSEFLKSEFTMTKERIYNTDHPDNWFFSARQWSKSADKEQQGLALAGIHADNTLFLIDEAGGIPDAVVATAEAAQSGGGDQRMVIAGNPTHLTGPLYRACTKERSIWYVRTMTGDPDNPNRSPRVSIEWARAQIFKYGRDNPWVLVNVFGEFPPASINALLGPDDVERAMKRMHTPEMIVGMPKIIGCDVAGDGGDRTVIFPRQGLVAFKPVVMRTNNDFQVASRIAIMDDKWDADGIFVDGTGGWGGSTIAKLRELRRNPIPVLFSAKALDRQYANLRAEMAFKMAQHIKESLMLPNIPEMVEELTALEYTYHGDQFILIDKDQIREKLGGRSPDHADALMTTYAYPVARKVRPGPFGQAPQPRQPQDYDPFSGFNQSSRNPVDDYNPLG